MESRLVPGKAADLRAVAEEAREFLLPLWQLERHGPGYNVPDSRGMCRKSSLFMVDVLAERGIKAELRHGAGRGGQGFRQGHFWKDHAWVETDEAIVCITTDQFLGEPPITITGRQDRRFGADPVTPVFPDEDYLVAEQWLNRWRSRAPALDSVLECRPGRPPGLPGPSAGV